MTGLEPKETANFVSHKSQCLSEAEAKEISSFEGVSFCIGSDHLAWVVQKVDNAIHHLFNNYPADNTVTHLLDSNLFGR